MLKKQNWVVSLPCLNLVFVIFYNYLFFLCKPLSLFLSQLLVYFSLLISGWCTFKKIYSVKLGKLSVILKLR